MSAAVGEVQPVRRALVAVYDKTGVAELCRELVSLGVSIVSSGGTAAFLSEAGTASPRPASFLAGCPVIETDVRAAR